MIMIQKMLCEMRHANNWRILLRLNHKRHHTMCSNYLSTNLLSAITVCKRRGIKIQLAKYLCQRYTTAAFNVQQPTIQEANAKVVYFPERKHAHDFFLNSIYYEKTTARLNAVKVIVSEKEMDELINQDWNAAKLSDILFVIKKLSYCDLNNFCDSTKYNFEPLLEALKNRISELDDQQFSDLLKHLIPFSKYLFYTASYKSFYAAADMECMNRFKTVSVDQSLYFCDLLYQLKLYRDSSYLKHVILRYGSRPTKLSSRNLVQLLFFISVYNMTPINMYELEYHLHEQISELSITEVGIAALGFFRKRTPIQSKNLINTIIDTVIKNVSTIDSITTGCVMKLIRYSIRVGQESSLLVLIRSLLPYLSQYQLMTLVHIVQALAKLQLYDKDIMNATIERLNRELPTARMKDIERIMYTICTFNLPPEKYDIYQNVINELTNRTQAEKLSDIFGYSNEITKILQYLSYLNIYPKHLIEYVFNPAYIDTLSRGNLHKLDRSFFVLEWSVKIELPEYTGPFLKIGISRFLAKKFQLGDVVIQKHCARNMLTTEAVNVCQKVFKSESAVYVTQVLPHYLQKDLILCLDKQQNVIPPEPILSSMTVGTIKYAPDEAADERQWIAIILGTDSLYVKGDATGHTGSLSAKIRQLKAIGYTPRILMENEWTQLSPKGKEEYIKHLVLT